MYDVLYVGDNAAGACAEVFNRGKYRVQWTPDMLRPNPSNRSFIRTLAWYEFDDATVTVDLDNPHELVARRLRPSDVITREYTRTQAWALAIYNSRRAAGVRWWSYNDARWASVGLWDLNGLTDYGAERLDIVHPAIAEAAEVLSIRVVRS